MIKHFCDRCGKEIKEEKVSVVTCTSDKGGTEPFEVCPYCYNSVMELLRGNTDVYPPGDPMFSRYGL